LADPAGFQGMPLQFVSQRTSNIFLVQRIPHSSNTQAEEGELWGCISFSSMWTGRLAVPVLATRSHIVGLSSSSCHSDRKDCHHVILGWIHIQNFRRHRCPSILGLARDHSISQELTSRRLPWGTVEHVSNQATAEICRVFSSSCFRSFPEVPRDSFLSRSLPLKSASFRRFAGLVLKELLPTLGRYLISSLPMCFGRVRHSIDNRILSFAGCPWRVLLDGVVCMHGSCRPARNPGHPGRGRRGWGQKVVCRQSSDDVDACVHLISSRHQDQYRRIDGYRSRCESDSSLLTSGQAQVSNPLPIIFAGMHRPSNDDECKALIIRAFEMGDTILGELWAILVAAYALAQHGRQLLVHVDDGSCVTVASKDVPVCGVVHMLYYRGSPGHYEFLEIVGGHDSGGIVRVPVAKGAWGTPLPYVTTPETGSSACFLHQLAQEYGPMMHTWHHDLVTDEQINCDPQVFWLNPLLAAPDLRLLRCTTNFAQ